MKKFMLAAATLAAMVFGTSAQAGDIGDLRFGIIGGLTSSSAKIKDVTTSSVAQYHIGATVEIPLIAGLTLQPAILYQVKGTNIGSNDSALSDILGNLGVETKGTTKAQYLEVPIQVQWGPDLIFFRPYVFAEPFVGYRLGGSDSGGLKNTSFNEELHKLEYGLGLGGGIEFSCLQLSVKYFWNFGDLYDGDGNASIQAAKDAINDGKNFNGVAVSLGIFF